MRSISRLLVMFSIFLLMISCASIKPLTKTEMGKVKNIVIADNLPEYPRYLIFGFSRLTSTLEKIPDKSFREKVVTTTSNYLQSKGYKVFLEKNIPKGTTIDLLLYFEAVALANGPDLYGFGVAQHYTFGVAGEPYTYAALAVSPSLSKDELRAGTRSEKYSTVTFASLSKKELANKWEDLPQNDKEVLIKSINSDIEETLIALMKQLGI